MPGILVHVPPFYCFLFFLRILLPGPLLVWFNFQLNSFFAGDGPCTEKLGVLLFLRFLSLISVLFSDSPDLGLGILKNETGYLC